LRTALALFLVLLAAATGAEVPDKSAEEPELPVLAGEEPTGRVFLWQNGQKLFLTPENEVNRLGGAAVAEGEEPVWSLWGWRTGQGVLQFWTQTVTLSKDGPLVAVTLDAELDAEESDLLARSEDSVLLVFGARSTLPRWELWKAGQRVVAKAWDDGRVYYAAALNPLGQLALVGRSGNGQPMVELAAETKQLEGYTGRLAALLWDAVSETPGWRAVGWAKGTGAALALVWNGQDWFSEDGAAQPTLAALSPTGELLAAGLGSAGAVGVWEPAGTRFLPEPAAAARVVALASAGEAGSRLVLELSPSGFALVDENGVTRLEGLAPGDRLWLPPPPVSPADAPAEQ